MVNKHTKFSLGVILFAVGGCVDGQIDGAPSTNPEEQGDVGEPEVAPPSEHFLLFQHAKANPQLRDTSFAVRPTGGFELGYGPPLVHIAGTRSNFLQLRTQTFPARYDLRTTGKLTAIRNQGGCGSCWAFATYGATESELLPGETRDFSEEHLNTYH